MFHLQAESDNTCDEELLISETAGSGERWEELSCALVGWRVFCVEDAFTGRENLKIVCLYVYGWLFHGDVDGFKEL